jgi:hypothetical protein
MKAFVSHLYIFAYFFVSSIRSRGVQHAHMGVRFACLDYLCALFARFATLSAQLLTRVSGVSDAGMRIIRLCRARTHTHLSRIRIERHTIFFLFFV